MLDRNQKPSPWLLAYVVRATLPRFEPGTRLKKSRAVPTVPEKLKPLRPLLPELLGPAIEL